MDGGCRRCNKIKYGGFSVAPTGSCTACGFENEPKSTHCAACGLSLPLPPGSVQPSKDKVS